MPRVLVAGALATVMAVALSLALFTRQSSAADQTVNVGPGISFAPANVTINLGDSVTFNWAGGFHGVRISGGPSSDQMQSGSFVFTPNAAGTFNYDCSVHGSSMTGSITVNAAQQQPTATATNTSVPPTSTPTAGPPTLTPTNTATTAPATATATATAAASTATPSPTAEATDSPAAEDGTVTPTSAAATATAGDATPGDTPDTPDAGDDDGDGTSWGVFIIGAVLFVAVVGGAIAVMGLRGRAA
jgi:plastocyanin